MLLIISQLTPANYECLISSSPSSGPPPNLYVGSATKIFASKSLHSLVMFSGIFILHAFIFSNSSSLFVPLRINGDWTVSISYIIHPTLHYSTAKPWPFLSTTSGDKYSGVPQIVLASVPVRISSFDKPKSVNFA